MSDQALTPQIRFDLVFFSRHIVRKRFKIILCFNSTQYSKEYIFQNEYYMFIYNVMKLI